MITDETYMKNDQEFIEVMTTDHIWIPIMATSLILLTKDNDAKPVIAVRVRNLEEEANEQAKA